MKTMSEELEAWLDSHGYTLIEEGSPGWEFACAKYEEIRAKIGGSRPPVTHPTGATTDDVAVAIDERSEIRRLAVMECGKTCGFMMVHDPDTANDIYFMTDQDAFVHALLRE